MRFACGDMRDHIVSYQNDHRPSYWRRRALRQQARRKIDFSEILRSYDFRLLQHYLPLTEVGRFHSITLSARAITLSGMVRPSAPAVLRFRANSKMTGCST